MAKSNWDISENNRFLESISSSAPFKTLLTKSKQKVLPARRSKFRSDTDIENIAPIYHNVQTSDPPLSASTPFVKKSPLKPKVNPAKPVPAVHVVQEQLPDAPEQPVKVVVRIRPGNGSSVTKVSKELVSIGDKRLKFDSVFDSSSTQGDVYELVGAPLVKDALSGYNTSIVAYGQTGSGKTYTMWGPPSAMVESPSVSGNQGLVPRIFQNLFSQIQKEQESSDDKQINYQCRCSFLEVYDEKIGDLLDQTQRNLEIEDDAKNGFYVENLTEEYVTSYEDVTQILIKGLSNRKIGATSVNSKSSRSHIMFIFMIESWCKESSSKCFGSSRSSRISLVDLAGYERDVRADTTKQHFKEGKYIKKSTSQLGHLVNILVEGSQSGKSEEAPYRRSCLTHLLRESFGGNAKLSIICTISPDNKSTNETLSTLRFGLRAKLMKNEPVVNEISEDDVNDLTDKIRQLKDELMRAKSSATTSLSSNNGYFSQGNVRESLNNLRLSLNRSLILPHIDNEPDEELCISEDDVNELRLQIDKISYHEEHLKEDSENGENTVLYSAEDFTCEHYLSCSEESETEEINSGETLTEVSNKNSVNLPLRNSLSIPGHEQTFLLEPVLSESPKLKNTQRKSSLFPSNNFSNQDDAVETSKNLEPLRQSLQFDNIRSSLRSSRIFPSPTESLAASLQKGLQIIDYHKRNSTSTRSSVSFSFGHLALKPCSSADEAATSLENGLPLDPPPSSFICIKCQGKETAASDEVEDNLRIVAVNESASADLKGLATKGTKDTENDLALAIEKEKELSSICKEQAAEIERLNQLLEQNKYEVFRTVVTGCHDSVNFSDGKNQLHQTNEAESDKCDTPNSENKLLSWNADENPEPEIMKEKCEIKEVLEEKSFSFTEREALTQEIEILKHKLQLSYTEATPRRSTDNLRSSLLSQSIQLRKSCAFSQINSKEEFEKERQKWMEMESDWISLTDELRIDIEYNRQRAEQVEMELRLEKKCTEELDDVLKRSVMGQSRMVEHYTELQEKYNDMLAKYRAISEAISEVKKAACKAGAKGRYGSRYAKALVAELSALRMERERERELLKKENTSLKIQLKDTAEAVHAAGELLVRLKEAEEAASVAESKSTNIQEENDSLKKQMEKLKRKHKMEMVTMKQYFAESKLPEAALRQPLYREDLDDISAAADNANSAASNDEDQAWRAEFGAIYQEQHY